MSIKIVPIDEIPKRTYAKGSIYDDLIEAFEKRDVPLARVEMTKKSDGLQLDGTYLSAQLRKRIKQLERTDITAQTVNGVAYLVRVG